MGDETERVVHAIRQRQDQELRATVSRYKGETYISLRTFWRPNESEVWFATKKGFTIRAELLEELELAIGALRRAIEAEPR